MEDILLNRRCSSGGKPRWVSHLKYTSESTICGVRINILNSHLDEVVDTFTTCKRCTGGVNGSGNANDR